MIFGISSFCSLRPAEGDDAYMTSNMKQLYSGDTDYRRYYANSHDHTLTSPNQCDVTVNNNVYIVTSLPRVIKPDDGSLSHLASVNLKERSNTVGIERSESSEEQQLPVQHSQYDTSSWYKRVNTTFASISQEAFTFMQSGLMIISDFSLLRISADTRRSNSTKLFSKNRSQSTMLDFQSSDIRDEVRQLFKDYHSESDLSINRSPMMSDEQIRSAYHHSIYFNTSHIQSHGTGKIRLPYHAPYSTWLATGFALNSKSGLSIAEPIRLPTNPGLFILGNFPNQVQISEHALLTYGINNYLNKELINVTVRIRASANFELIEQANFQHIPSKNNNDYTTIIPLIKSFGIETRHLVLVPRHTGVAEIILEVESEFGGDYEILTTYVRESGIERSVVIARLFDLTNKNKPYDSIIETMSPSPFLRSIQIDVSGIF